MSRPMKSGLDYYPMDVGFLRDKKVRLLRAEFGASSVLFVLYVLGKVYEGDGYFLTWDQDETLTASIELQESPAYISEVLQGCLSRSLFDERVFQMFGVLTSAGIQRRYLRGCEKRGVINIYKEYWLLDSKKVQDVPAGILNKLAFFSINGGNNPVNSPGNPVNSLKNPQSKVKESKVKESKVKESKVKESKVNESKVNDSPLNPPKGTSPLPSPQGGIPRQGGEATDAAPKKNVQQERFDAFWSRYPKKVGKKAAWSAWQKIKPDAALFERMLQVVDRAKVSDQWRRNNGQFIPHPTTWLNQGRWDDEPTSQPTAQSTTEISKEAAEWLKDEL